MQGNLGELEQRMWQVTYSLSSSLAKPITIQSPQVTLVRDRIEYDVELNQAEWVGHPIAASRAGSSTRCTSRIRLFFTPNTASSSR